MSSLRVVFAGTGTFAATVLQVLVTHANVVAVITQPSRRKDTNGKILPNPVTELAQRSNIAILDPERIRTIVSDLETIAPDVLIVADYGQIIPDTILNIPRKGALNLHPSLLPKYRGATPIESAILAGDNTTGVTLMVMDSEMDHGAIVAQTSNPLSANETAPELEAKLAFSAAKLLINNLENYLQDKIVAKEQNHNDATYTAMLTKESGFVSEKHTVLQVLRMHRALQPWPGIWSKVLLGGKEKRIKFLNIKKWNGELAQQKINQLFHLENRLGFKLSDGAVQIVEAQIESGKPQTAKDLINGYRIASS
ncbi:MAG: methionyl-tRNA formyltransferase [Patescibacteria group bacterium]|jgi:methionyl-tRNA formyltransferase